MTEINENLPEDDELIDDSSPSSNKENIISKDEDVNHEVRNNEPTGTESTEQKKGSSGPEEKDFTD